MGLKPTKKTLTKFEDVVISAFDSGSLAEDIYNQFVKLGVKDVRQTAKVHDWLGDEPGPEVCYEEPCMTEEPVPDDPVAEKVQLSHLI